MGQNPIAQFSEQGQSGNLNIISPQVNISTLSVPQIKDVSTINGVAFPGSGGNVSTFSTIYVSSLFANNASVSTLNVSSISDFGGSAVISTVTSQTILTSTLAFAPTVGGFNPKIDLGMGGFLGGLAGEGAGILGAALGAAALGTGIAGLAMPRTTNNISPTKFETINGTTQLQVSTLGSAVSSILRFVSSSSTTVPGKEIFVSTVIAPGTTCIRSMSDPLNLANSNFQTSTIQSFGQWTALPTGSGGGGGPSQVIPELVISSLNSFSWDQIQYANQQPLTEPGSYIVVNSSNQYLYIAATINSPTPQYQSQVVVLDPGDYTLSEFVDMAEAAASSQGVAAGQLRFSVQTGGKIGLQLIPQPLSPYTQSYTVIWNSTPLPNFPFAGFTPPITAPALAASSAIWGANSLNVTLQTTDGPIITTLPATPTLTPNPIGPIPFGANLQVSSIAFPVNTSSNAGAIQMGGVFSMYDLTNHVGNGTAYVFNPYTTLTGSFGTILSVRSPNGISQAIVAADNSGGPQIIATTNGSPGTLTVSASQMNVVSISSLSSINGAIYPPPASQTISTFQNLFTSSFNVSSINGTAISNFGTSTFQNLFTSSFNVSSINGTSWSNIQFLNQSGYPDTTDSGWVVNNNNNVLCLISFISGVQRFAAIPLTIGTYLNATFTTMVNGAIQTFATANPLYQLQYIVFSVAVQSGSFFSLFTLGAGAPAPPAQYTLSFIPANFANFPPATSAQIVGSALLFGAGQVEYFLSTATPTQQMPTANTTPAPPLPPRAFGSDLQVSSINIRGVPVLPSGAENPPGAIIMFGGQLAPAGWLLCDGTAYSPATYPLLFNAIGYLYGGAANSFQVPDFQTRVPVGSITASVSASPAVMTVPNNGGSSAYVIIQLGTTAVTTTPINIIVPGCIFTGNIGTPGTYTVVQMLYADYGRNVYFCQINATLGGAGQVLNGTISYPNPSQTTPNTTLPYQPGYTAPAYFAPSLTPSQLPPHAHTYNILKGGAATYNVNGGNQSCGDPNTEYTTGNTTQTIASQGGPGFDTAYLNFPAGLIGPQNVVALGVQPIPSVSVSYIIKV